MGAISLTLLLYKAFDFIIDLFKDLVIKISK